MKLPAILTAAFLLGACATSPGLPPGKFVPMACADGKTFSVRASENGETVRVRAHHGSAELDRKADGAYEGEGYRLTMAGEGGISLMHDGKPQGRACRPAA